MFASWLRSAPVLLCPLLVEELIPLLLRFPLQKCNRDPHDLRQALHTAVLVMIRNIKNIHHSPLTINPDSAPSSFVGGLAWLHGSGKRSLSSLPALGAGRVE